MSVYDVAQADMVGNKHHPWKLEQIDDDEVARIRTFTGRKLDWLKAVSYDKRVKPGVFEVAFCIVQHVNEKTLIAILSDETIIEKTGISRAEVGRHRKSLKDTGWLSWRRTRTANLYTPIFDETAAWLDELAAKGVARRARRATQREQWMGLAADSSPASDHLPSPAIEGKLSPTINIHPQGNTSGSTPVQKGVPAIEHNFVRVSDPKEAAIRLLECLGGGDVNRGEKLAAAIGPHRYMFLLKEMMLGSLHPSAVYSATASGGTAIGDHFGRASKVPEL